LSPTTRSGERLGQRLLRYAQSRCRRLPARRGAAAARGVPTCGSTAGYAAALLRFTSNGRTPPALPVQKQGPATQAHYTGTLHRSRARPVSGGRERILEWPDGPASVQCAGAVCQCGRALLLYRQCRRRATVRGEFQERGGVDWPAVAVSSRMSVHPGPPPLPLRDSCDRRRRVRPAACTVRRWSGPRAGRDPRDVIRVICGT
jgi:hypothetical protein